MKAKEFRDGETTASALTAVTDAVCALAGAAARRRTTTSSSLSLSGACGSGDEARLACFADSFCAREAVVAVLGVSVVSS